MQSVGENSFLFSASEYCIRYIRQFVIFEFVALEKHNTSLGVEFEVDM